MMKKLVKYIFIAALTFPLCGVPCTSYDETAEYGVCAITCCNAEIGKTLLSSLKVYTTFVESTSFCYNFGGTNRKVYTNALHAGSAVLYQIDGDDTFLLTNYHVIYDGKADAEANGGNTAKEIYCYLYGSEGSPCVLNETDETYGYKKLSFGDNAIKCEYVGGSILSDIAVLRANTQDLIAINENIRAVDLADGYCVGETAIAIGNPEGEGISVTQGIVSVDNEYIHLNIDGTTRNYRSIRIDTPLYSGNSGGGLFNANGKLIGITNAGNGNDENINYAIPLRIVRGAADNLIHYYKSENKSGAYVLASEKTGLTLSARRARYAYDESLGYGLISEDIVVDSVTEDSIAQQTGIRAGDVLSAVIANGGSFKLNRTFDLSDFLLNVRAGDKIGFVFTRDGCSKTSELYEITENDLTPLL